MSLLTTLRRRGGGPSLVSDGLLAEYRFDDGSGQVLTDYSGNGYHMQLGSTSGADENDPTWTAAGLTFAPDDYCVSTEAALRPDAWTVQVVFADDSSDGGFGSLFGWTDAANTPGLFSYFSVDNQPMFYANTAGDDDFLRWTSGVNINDGSYRCLSFNCAGTSAANIAASRCYLNTDELVVASGSADSACTAKSVSLIGRVGTRYLTGKIAYCLLYNRALTEDEMLQNYTYMQLAVAERSIVLPSASASPAYLDDFSADMVSAYGSRRLISTYTDPLMKVRRSSDDTELDIGSLSDGTLDIGSLKSFVGAGSGYVTTLYDQVGSADAVQTTDAEQPRIVTSGVVERAGSNNLPAVLYPEGSSASIFTTTAGISQPFTTLNVASFEGDDSQVGYVQGSRTATRADIAIDGGSTGDPWAMYSGSWFQGPKSFDNDVNSLFGLFNGALSTLSASGEFEFGNPGAGGNLGFRIGNLYDSSATYVLKGHHCELVVWDADISTSRPALESLIGSYYGIDYKQTGPTIEAYADDYSPATSSTITYTVDVTNENEFTLSDVDIVVSPPAGLTLSSATPGTGSYTGGLWSVGDMVSSATAQISVECSVTAADTVEIDYPFFSRCSGPSGCGTTSFTVRVFVGDLDAQSSAYQAAGDTVPVGGEPEQDWSASSGASDSGKTWILPGRAARQDCVASSARLWINTAGAGGWKIKHFRWTGATYEYQGEEDITVAGAGAQTVTFSDITLQMSDVLGIYVPADGALETITCDLLTEVRVEIGDISTDNAFSTGVAYGIPLDVYGNRPYLAVSGDSIAAGNNATPNFWNCWLWNETAALDISPGGTATSEIWNQVQADYTDLEYQNHALGSRQWTWVLSTAVEYIERCTPHTVVVICGTNDIGNEKTLSSVLTIMDQVKLAIDIAGIRRMTICEILPRTSFDDIKAATVRTWNTSYASWCKSNGVQLITCHDALGQIRVSTGELDDLSAAYNSGDDVHLSTAGVEALSGLIQDQL